MKVLCENCGGVVPPERVAALPGVRRCAACVQAAGDPRVKGRNVFDHKTGGYVEVLTAQQRQAAIDAENSIDDRVSRL